MAGRLSRRNVIFEGAKIDGRRVQLHRERESGRVSALSGFLSGPLEGPPEEAASEFLDANRRLLQSSRGILSELKVQKVTRSPAGYHVVFQQTHQGVPVEEAKVSVHLTSDNRVHAAQVRLEPGVRGVDVDQMSADGIDADEAVRIALSTTDNSVASRPEPQQVLLIEDKPHLAWKVSFSTERPVGERVVWVDARTGRVLQRRDVAFD
jgi:Zn-dependent metalloprotease